MKAVVIEGYGDESVLRYVERPQPKLAEGTTLVRIHAIGVNPADGKWRSGMLQQYVPLTFPHILGYDIAGEVVESDVFAPGDAVVGLLDVFAMGAYAEYAVAPSATLCRKPQGLSWETAAAIPCAGLTGTQLISRALEVEAGQRVLITGALGAVGRFAMAEALRRGAEVVAAVREEHRVEARALGATGTLVLAGGAWEGGAFDRVADTVGGADVARLCRHLAPGGRIATVATTPIPAEGLAAEPQLYGVQQNGPGLQDLCDSVAAGRITVPVSIVLPLSEASEAQRLTAAGGLGGKVVLRP